MLPRHLGGGEARVFLLDDETADDTVELRPDDGQIGYGAVGDPHLGAVEQVVVPLVLGSSDHVAGIGAVVWLREAEAADPFASVHLGQVVVLLLLAAEVPYRVHSERALHAGERAHAAVASLELLADQAVCDV